MTEIAKVVRRRSLVQWPDDLCSQAPFTPLLLSRRGVVFLQLFWQAAVDCSSDFLHQQFAAAELLRFYRIVKDDLCYSWLYGEPSLGHDLVCSYDRDRDYGNVTFSRQIKRAFLERQQSAVKRSPTLDINGHVDAAFDDGSRCANRSN